MITECLLIEVLEDILHDVADAFRRKQGAFGVDSRNLLVKDA